MRSTCFAAFCFIVASTCGCAALTGLSSLEECSGSACADASTADTHVGDQGIDTNDGSTTTDAADAADANDTGGGTDSKVDDTNDAGRDADAIADTKDAADTNDTAIDTLDSGPCALPCDTAHSLGGTCVGGKCVYSGCNAGWANCNTTGTDVDGCETSITTITNCGGCGNTCDTSTSVPTACAGGTCIYTCKPGFADCDSPAVDPHDLNGCETPTNTITNCAGCGNKCDTLQSIGPSCDGTTCKYTGCKTGFKDCNTTAPDTDGCETATTTTTDCGACGAACDTVNSTPLSCTGGTCNYTCKSGHWDCDSDPGNLNGCECPGPTSGATGCCTGTTLSAKGTCMPTHSNGPASIGLGQTYYDCRPLGTPSTTCPATCGATCPASGCAGSGYDATLATEAAEVSPYRTAAGGTVGSGYVCGDPTGTSSGCLKGIADSRCAAAQDPITKKCYVWCYDGPLAGLVAKEPGPPNPDRCYCPCPPPWTSWN